jgi:hypothetical protein
MRGIATAGMAVLAVSLAGAVAIPVMAKAAPAVKAKPASVKVTVVKSGLNAPRHLLASAAGVVVTEAGVGGPVGKSNCATGPSTEGAGTTQFCSGMTGEIVWIPSSGKVVPVLTKLASVVEVADGETTGPSAISFAYGEEAVAEDDFLTHKDGTNGLAPQPNVFGDLVLMSGRKTKTVGIAAYAAAHPQPASALGTFPGEVPWDSDPYDVIAYRGGWAVADAGADDVVWVSKAGKVSLLARFPAVPETVPAGVIGNPKPITVQAQAVPTSLAVGPDGALYVGLLRGAPSSPGGAYIYRVEPGKKSVIWAKGLTTVTDIAFDRQGRLLATEFNVGGLLSPPTVPGALVRISNHGKTVKTLPVSGLFQPTGLAVTANGTVYVSNYGDSTTKNSKHGGALLKITGLS